MNDLISREEARNLMYHKQDSLTEYDLDSLPSVDAEPVRHGHWKLIEVDGEDYFGNVTRIHLSSVCSVCGHGTELYSPPYCPNCGAKMDGE